MQSMKKISILVFSLFLGFFSKGNAPIFNIDTSNENTLYEMLHLFQSGLKFDIFQKALIGWHKLYEAHQLANPTIISIIDYSQSSNNKRLYIIDLMHQKVLFNTYVAHGKNTGAEFASNFSNEPNSLKTSLGFYITAAPIMSSKHGEALLINGVEKGFNDNAANREIIIHAANYVCEQWIHTYGMLGRSFGCPAIPPALTASIIATIKAGTCLFLYYPNDSYIRGSRLLN